MGSNVPPPLAERLLSFAVTDADWRASIVGDLREEFAVESSRRGVRAARRWYWQQVFAIGWRTVGARFGASHGRIRDWEAPRDRDLQSGWRVGLTRDLAHSCRAVIRRPGLSATIVLTLGLALAANSTIFALLDAIVLRPFRFPGVERLVMVSSSNPNEVLDTESVANADFRDWRRDLKMIENLTATEWWDANLSGVDQPEQVAGFRVTAEFFDALGVPPVHGRGFLRSEEALGQHRRVVLGYELWTRRFAADPSIVGQTVRLDAEPYQVVGVAPPGFAIPMGAQVWAPIAYTAEEWDDRRGSSLRVFGRLRDDVSIEQAEAEVLAIAARLRREYPDTNADRPALVVDFTTGMRDPGAARFLGVWQAAAIILLLIACANVANLLLARGAERSQEFAIRLALGAGRGRIVWQVLLEGALLAVAAVLIAVPLAWIALTLSRGSIPPSVIRFVPGWRYIALSVPLFALTALLGALATLLFAMVPAMQAAKAGVSETLRQTGRTTTASRQRHWGRNLLATAQVALSLALLSASGLMLAASDRAIGGSPGFDKRDLLTGQVSLPPRSYADAEKRRQFISGVLDRMSAVPAVESSAVVSSMPGSGSNASREFWPDGPELRTTEVRTVYYRRISDHYFAAMRIPVLAGRVFNTSDRPTTQPVAIVSRALAQRYWPGEDPLGKRFRNAADGPLITVVGVVGDVRHDWFRDPQAPTMYRPALQDAPYAIGFVLRTHSDPLALAADLRRAVAAVDPDQPITAINSMERVLVDRASGITFIAQSVAVVAAIAFVLALTGLYSLISFIAARRTQELGVRLALGARRWDVIKLTTGQALGITAAGTLVGAAMSAGVGQLMESMLLGVVLNSYGQLAFLVVALLIVALLAAYLPARRAADLDPTVALRAE